MTTHIVWAVIWFVLMLASFNGGIIAAWVTGVGSLLLRDEPTAKNAFGGVVTGVVVLLLAWAFAGFSLIKVILQIIAAFHS